MNKKEYDAFCKAHHEFMEREGLSNLSGGHHVCPNCHVEWNDNDKCPSCGEDRESMDERYFSKRYCECCRRPEGGDRYHATGYNREHNEIREYEVCEDCLYFAEHGCLDDTTMMDIDEEE